MSKDLYIYGVGGHAKVVTQIISEASDYKVCGYINDNANDGDSFLGVKVYTFDSFCKLNQKNVFIAIGDNFLRKKVHIKLEEVGGFSYPNIISKYSNITHETPGYVGTCVMPGVSINYDTALGCFNVINTNASIDHDCNLGDFVFVGPSAAIAGNVTIKELSLIGINSTIIQGLTIGDNSIIGAGSVVTRDIDSSKVCYGVPAKVIKEKVKDLFF